MNTKTVRVIATADAFVDGSRRRAGSEFDMTLPVDAAGEVKLPKWALLANAENRRAFEKQKNATAQKAADAAIASSGGGYARKPKTFIEAMNAGRGSLNPDGDKMEAAVIASATPAGAATAKKKAYEEALGRGQGPQKGIL